MKPLIDRFPSVGMTYRSLRDSRAMRQEPVVTPLGFRFSGHPDMERGQYESIVVEIVREHLHTVDVFVNVGANVGYYCCIARQAGKKTIAFEPVDLNLQYLYRNLKANDWSDVEVFPLALSNRTGLTEIHGWGTGASLISGWAGIPKGYSRIVPVSTLDTILGGRFAGKRCFFLVDVEGVEQQVLEGAIAQINLSPKPVWMVEVSVAEHQPSGVSVNPNLLTTFEIFWKAGYEAWTVDAQRRPVSRDEVVAIAVGGQDTLGTHNFLFTGK